MCEGCEGLISMIYFILLKTFGVFSGNSSRYFFIFCTKGTETIMTFRSKNQRDTA